MNLNFQIGITYVRSGPFIDSKVKGRLPGDSLDVKRGAKLMTTAHAFGHGEQVPLQSMEIVGHGEVLAAIATDEVGQSPERLDIEMALPVEHGLWIATRCSAGVAQVGHTTPVYVTVDDGGFHNPKRASAYLDLGEQHLREIEEEIANLSDRPGRQVLRYAEELRTRIAEAWEAVANLKKRLE